MNHYIEKEKKLIDLLGYSIVGPNGSNRWYILDKDQNQVGYIQYKKLHGRKVKKGNSKIFGYQTMINSSDILYESTRESNDRSGKIIEKTDSNYSFYVKRNDNDLDFVEMNLGKFPSLNLTCKDYGFIIFEFDNRGLYLNYKSVTDKYNIKETLIYQNVTEEGNNCKKEYTYQISYFKKGLNLSDDEQKGRTTLEISCVQYLNNNQVTIYEKTYKNGKLISETVNRVEGTIEQMVTTHQVGIDCFNYFRSLINQIIPFKDEIISLMIKDDIASNKGLSVFLDNNWKDISERKIQKELSLLKKQNT